MKTTFWKDVTNVLYIFKFLVLVLRLVDDEKPTMGYIYEAMNHTKENIKNVLEDKLEKYGPICDNIDRRRDNKLHHSLHAVEYYLNPQFYYSNVAIESNGEIKQRLYNCIEKLVKSTEEQDMMMKQLAVYRASQGLFGRDMAIRQQKISTPCVFF